MSDPEYVKLHESQYGEGPQNFHIAKHGDELHAVLTYPPWTDADNTKGQCRYVYVNQEAVRASDGVRLHYDYERDGFVVEQPKPRLRALGGDSYTDEEEWIEVGFFASWAFNNREDGSPSDEEYRKADEEFAATPAQSQ
jgi:hypothetical protein